MIDTVQSRAFEVGCVLTCSLFPVSLHDWRREAVQSFPAQPLCRAPPGSGCPAIPGRRLDPVQGKGAGGTAKTQRPLQQEIVLPRRPKLQGTAELSCTRHWYKSSYLQVKANNKLISKGTVETVCSIISVLRGIKQFLTCRPVARMVTTTSLLHNTH